MKSLAPPVAWPPGDRGLVEPPWEFASPTMKSSPVPPISRSGAAAVVALENFETTSPVMSSAPAPPIKTSLAAGENTGANPSELLSPT